MNKYLKFNLLLQITVYYLLYIYLLIYIYYIYLGIYFQFLHSENILEYTVLSPASRCGGMLMPASLAPSDPSTITSNLPSTCALAGPSVPEKMNVVNRTANKKYNIVTESVQKTQ